MSKEESDRYLQLRIDPRRFLRGLIKTGASSAVQDPKGLVEGAYEIGESLGFSQGEAAIVSDLYVGALHRVATNVIRENFGLQASKERLRAVKLQNLTAGVELRLPENVFKNAFDAGVISALSDQLENWFVFINVDGIDAKNIATRVRGTLARALHDEWRSNPARFEALTAGSSSPFQVAASSEAEWEYYRSSLISEVHGAVFDETFDLKSIYIPLRCSHSQKNRKKIKPNDAFVRDDIPEENQERAIADAGALIDRFIVDETDFDLLAISGGPGSGKSSLAKMMAANLADSGTYVLFFPLHQMEMKNTFESSATEYLAQAGYFTSSVFESVPIGEKIVIILDGLDELQMQGSAIKEEAIRFVEAISRWLDVKNVRQNGRIKALITGRDLAIQDSQSFLRHEGQVLHLLPYYIQTGERFTPDPGDLSKVDQRDEWWRKYTALTGREVTGIPAQLKVGELGDVTAQPLLNYLVALSYFRGRLNLGTTSINGVYADLLEAVYERAWARTRHPATRGMSFQDFTRVLEEVALSVWHGAGRSATLEEVERHCDSSRIASLVSSLGAEFSSGLSSLLLAFYFRRKGRRDDGSQTFEFTHKSFAEFLTARRVVRLVRMVADKVEQNQKDPDEGWDAREALERWLEVMGNTAVDGYLRAFIAREIDQFDIDYAATVQKNWRLILEYVLRTDWPIERLAGLSLKDQRARTRNAEESLWVCLSAISGRTREISLISWPDDGSAGQMLNRLQVRRTGPLNVIAFNCLTRIDFSGCRLDMADFYQADLSHSSFKGAALQFANLARATLFGCDFTDAKFLMTNFFQSELEGATFFMYDVADDNKMRRYILSNSKGISSMYDRPITFLRRAGAIVEMGADEPDE